MKKHNLKSMLLVSAAFILSSCETSNVYEVQAAQSGQWDFSKEQNAESNLYELGRSYLSSHDLGLAINTFNRDIHAQGPNVLSLNGLGIAYDMLGRYDLSQKYYEQALELEPESSVTYSNLAYSQYKQGDYENAALLAEAAQNVQNPENLPPLLSVVKVAKGNQSLARKMQEESLMQDPVSKSAEVAFKIERTSERQWAMVKPEKDSASSNVKYRSNLAIGKILKKKSDSEEKIDIEKSLKEKTAENEKFGPVMPAVEFAEMATPEEENLSSKIAEGLDKTLALLGALREDEDITWFESPTYRILNGTGRPKMARRAADFFIENGFEVPSLGDAGHYGYKESVIEYSPGHKEKAEMMAKLLPHAVQLKEIKSSGAYVVLILGEDMLQFDSSRYILQNGEYII